MAAVLDQGQMVVRTAPAVEMDDAQFFEFCQINRDLRIERNAKGDLIIMAPAGGSSGRGNSELNYVFQEWARRDGKGQVFDSSTGFVLPNGAMRAPDVSWVRNARLKLLPDEKWQTFLPLCPDFVLELSSPTDSMRELKKKMEEYIANGARLGWLLDAAEKRVFIYRPGSEAELIKNPGELSASPVLQKFVLDVPQIWAVMERRK